MSPNPWRLAYVLVSAIAMVFTVVSKGVGRG